MPKGKLSCICSFEGSCVVLRASSHGKVVGLLCESCAWDNDQLDRFIVAAGWLYGWHSLTFTLVGAGHWGMLRRRLLRVIADLDETEGDSKEMRLTRRAYWLTRGHERGSAAVDDALQATGLFGSSQTIA